MVNTILILHDGSQHIERFFMTAICTLMIWIIVPD